GGAPTVPLNLTATAFSTSQINLAWNVSTDNIGVVGYKVERCQGSGCANFTQIATTVSPSYSNTGLISSTSYSYRVIAYDAASNNSPASNAASATTQTAPDTQAPTVPGNLVVSPNSGSPTQMDLTWNLSTDNVGVVGYKIERCQANNCSSFVQIATVASNSYSDINLTPNTNYSYRIRSYDAAGNNSAYSGVISAITKKRKPN
ncbi:MAG: fibronectin type III domain-containing protein, partial [Candidatus Doudnabacteria bacterium]|nr:fibronectin type III domain-containing protein [Candidatus Doudnabacteria bacterium]